MSAAVLLAEPEPQIRGALERQLSGAGFAVFEAGAGLSKGEVNKRVDRRDFPRAVIQLTHGRLWLKEEVEKYKRGESTADEGMEENALRHLYLTREEVMKRTGLSGWQLSHKNAGRKSLEPDVYLGKVSLWLPETVEAWEKDSDSAVG